MLSVSRIWFALVLASCARVEDKATSREPWTDAPALPGPRADAAVTALGTRLAVVGGFSTSAQAGSEITREVLVFDTLAREWSTLPEAPAAWTHAGLGSSGGSLYLLGG